MMIFNYKTHVKITCDLSIGETVSIDGFGPELNGKTCIIKDIKFHPGSESSVMVKLDKFDDYIDSNWVVKKINSASAAFLQEASSIVSDDEIDKAWGSADFGKESRREVIRNTLLKCASGYYTGFTAKCIVRELGLVKQNEWALTMQGQKYLFAAYANGLSI